MSFTGTLTRSLFATTLGTIGAPFTQGDKGKAIAGFGLTGATIQSVPFISNNRRDRVPDHVDLADDGVEVDPSMLVRKLWVAHDVRRS